MADNTEYLPQIGVIDDTRTSRNYKLIGDGNVVAKTSSDVVVNGVNNFVGEDCQRINVLASSGCVITSGTTDVSIINSSGITVNAPGGVTYIDGLQITSDSFIVSGVTASQGIKFVSSEEEDYQMTTDDYTVVVTTSASESDTEIYLPDAAGQTQVFRVKAELFTTEGVTVQVRTFEDNGFIDEEQIIELLAGDAITVQSDGSSNYYIL